MKINKAEDKSLNHMINSYIQNWFDIIENMSNDNTYKLAWGRSILETIRDMATFSNKTVTISFDELSPKIIKYYWNQIYFFNLTQGPKKKPIIEQKVNQLIERYQKETNSKIPVWYEKAELHFSKNKNEYEKFIKEISKVLSENVSWRFLKLPGKDEPVQLYSLDNKNRTITFSKEQTALLNEYSFPLSQLLNYRWAQLLELFNTAPRISSKVKGLSDNKLKRSSLSKYKKILLEMYDGNPIDFYTGKVLADNNISVDHVIPWSFMYSDDIWNLVLTSKQNNSKKSNSIPSRAIIKKLKERNIDLLKIINNADVLKELKECIDNDYLEKFYNSLTL